jgi:ABC-2 type transport system permease protein
MTAPSTDRPARIADHSVGLTRSVETTMRTLRDTRLIYVRSLMLTLRNPVWVMVGLTQPIFFLVLFGPLLEGVSAAGGATANAYNVFVPGLLVYLALFTTAFVGFGLIAEMRAGVIERMRVTPVSRVAMLLGRSLRDVTILLVQAILLVAVAVPFGLVVDLEGLVVTLFLMVLVGLFLAPLSYALGLLTKDENAFAPIINLALLPILLLSGVLLPMAFAPGWLQTLADLNPLSYAVDAARALFNGSYADPVVLTGVVLMAVLAAAAVWVGARAFGRSVA